MDKQSVLKFFKGIRSSAVKHGPEILTAVGIVGMATTTIIAVKATPKALRLIEERKEELDMGPDEKLPPIEVVKVAWKPYIPAAVTGVASIGCLVGASSVNARRNAALTAAYQLSTTALNDYRAKVVDTIGEKKEQEVRKAISQDKVEKNPPNQSTVIVTGNGDSLMYDTISGRYFESSISKVKDAEQEINGRMLDGMEMYMSLNEFYDELGLDHIPLGDDLGWTVNKRAKVTVNEAHITKDGKACLVLDYIQPPEHGYRDYY